MLFRNKVIFALNEVTYGTDPTPSGTDAVLTSNLSIQPYAGPVVSRNNDRATLGGETVINVNPQVQVSFDVEIAGSGSAGTLPAWAGCLLACGFAQADSSPTGTSKIFTPLSSTWPSLTIYFYHDGMRHRILGARGNVSFNFQKGEIPRMSYTFTGQYETPTASAAAGTDVSDYVVPVAVTNDNTPTFTFGGSPLQSLKADQFTFDMGNNVVPRNVINSEEIIITDRAVTGSTQFEMVLPSTYDWFANLVESHNGITEGVMQLIHGTVSGNIVQIDCPQVQVTSFAPQDSDGLLTYSAGLAINPTSTGNDEITITVY